MDMMADEFWNSECWQFEVLLGPFVVLIPLLSPSDSRNQYFGFRF